MASKKSISGMKILDGKGVINSISFLSIKDDASVEIKEKNISELADKLSIPKNLLANMVKSFGIKFDEESITKLVEDRDETGMIIGSARATGLVIPEYRKKIKFGDLSEFEMRDINFKKIKTGNLQETGIMRDLIDLMRPNGVESITIPNGTMFNADLMIDTLRIIFKSFPKTEDVRFFTGGVDMPMVIRVENDYDFWLAPKVEEPELWKVEGGRSITLEDLIQFATLPKSEIERLKEIKKIKDIQQVRKQYRDIQKLLREINIPDTIQDIGKYGWEEEVYIIRDIKEIFGQVNEKIKKELSKISPDNWGWSHWTKIGDPIKEIEKIYNEYLKTSKKRTLKQEEIVKIVGKLIDEIKSFYTSIQQKIDKLRTNLIDITKIEDLNKKVSNIEYGVMRSTIHHKKEAIIKEFYEALLKEIPSLNYEYYDKYHFYVSKGDLNKFEKIVTHFNKEIDKLKTEFERERKI